MQKKKKTLAEAQKQFMRLCEWSYVPSTLEEDDMEQDQMPNDGDMSQDPQGGMGDNGNMPPMGDNQMPPMDDNQGMGGDMNQDGNQIPPMDDNQPIDDGQMPPMGDEMGMDDMEDIDEPEDLEDEEVIDVDQLTDAQETMNTKVNSVGHDLGQVDSKITQLLSTLEKMEQMIDNNNQEIQNFKKEFEKRNPTQTEKLNLRSLDSYPFNVSPQKYWADKGIDPNSNYSGYADNSEPTTQEYELTNNDVDNFDERMIERSFDVADDLQQDLKKIFGF